MTNSSCRFAENDLHINNEEDTKKCSLKGAFLIELASTCYGVLVATSSQVEEKTFSPFT